MPQNWKTYKLGEVIISANTGLDAIKRAPIVEEDTGIKCLRIQDVSQSKDFTNWGFCFVTEENFKKFALNKGEIIIARTGNTIGVNMFIHENIKAVFNNGLIRIRINKEICDAKYVFYNFRSKKFTDYIQSIAFGTSTQPNMQIGSLLNFDFFVPSLPEQTAIASILSALDDKIELNLQMNKTLEEMAMALYKHWFIDFGPFKDGEFVESELGMIPKGWEVKKLEEFSTIIMGQSPKSEFYNDERKGLPFHQGVKDFGIRFPTDITFSTSGNKIAEKGDILFSVRAPVGRINIAKNKLVLGRGLASIKMKEGNGFLLYALKNFFQKEDIIGSGTVFNSVNKTEIENIKFVMPEINKFMEFNEKVLQLDEMIYSNFLEIENLKNQRDSLLPKLISGEIRVKDLEKN